MAFLWGVVFFIPLDCVQGNWTLFCHRNLHLQRKKKPVTLNPIVCEWYKCFCFFILAFCLLFPQTCFELVCELLVRCLYDGIAGWVTHPGAVYTCSILLHSHSNTSIPSRQKHFTFYCSSTRKSRFFIFRFFFFLALQRICGANRPRKILRQNSLKCRAKIQPRGRALQLGYNGKLSDQPILIETQCNK